LALFAGAGGGILGGHLLGWRCVCAVEWEPYPASVLIARQNEGILPPFPIWDDVRTFDGRPWRGRVDVVSGGFPCQDISSAGKGAGIDGERSGMWKEMARIIGEVRPQFAIVENSPILTSRGLGIVLGDLAELGYDAEWGVLGAEHAGGLHNRGRIWILAYANQDAHPMFIVEREPRDLLDRGADPGRTANVATEGLALGLGGVEHEQGMAAWAHTEPGMDRMANGMAAKVDRLGALGNGQVPAVVRLAWRTLYARIQSNKAA